jgi:hypothetical protein
LLESGMLILLVVVIAQGRLGDEASQGFHGECSLPVGKLFPHAGLRDRQIEEVEKQLRQCHWGLSLAKLRSAACATGGGKLRLRASAIVRVRSKWWLEPRAVMGGLAASRLEEERHDRLVLCGELSAVTPWLCRAKPKSAACPGGCGNLHCRASTIARARTKSSIEPRVGNCDGGGHAGTETRSVQAAGMCERL